MKSNKILPYANSTIGEFRLNSSLANRSLSFKMTRVVNLKKYTYIYQK